MQLRRFKAYGTVPTNEPNLRIILTRQSLLSHVLSAETNHLEWENNVESWPQDWISIVGSARSYAEKDNGAHAQEEMMEHFV